jgi:predicted short-subunit dehydrogenase-like oxidoreductase (DUF2520 family)
MTKERIALVGAGAAGGALVLALHRAGYPIAGVASRSIESARRCAALIDNPPATCDPAPAVVSADIIILATPDGQIEPACRAIAEQGVIRPGQLFLHLSGALTSDVLDPARRKGAEVLSLHPIQALADPVKGAELLRGTWFCLEGSAAAIGRGEALVKAMQGETLIIPAEHKALYHAALSVAANYLVTIESIAVSLLERIGIERQDGLQAILPLIAGSVQNLAHSGLPNALTGPISRGDSSTVARHIDSLRGMPPAHQAIYRMLGKETVELALEKGGLDAEQAEEIRRLLTPQPPDPCLIS